eukprot:12418962-Karenia_brevis.AAC.1
MEPFVIMFLQKVQAPGLGHIRLCADDIAAVVTHFRVLHVLSEIFRAAESCAGLCLNTKKCILVPLGPFTPHRVEMIRNFLIQHISQWSRFQVSTSAEYLGLWLGPAASAKHWIMQTAKFLTRVQAFANAQLAASVAVK